MPDEMLKPEEIARDLRVTPRTVRNYVKRGHLRAVTLPVLRIRRSDYVAFLKARQVAPK